ncbi:hypothetical protein [Phocaeicola massiliensis]|mgnify:FL=1|jgi:hypothetical protein|uniref:hypothetical protein n=1 Tax=Phocaeicola massiliensis TaxID=204516 RepID=UPI000E3F148E|nr:hypothetical protein [Phocaeicola massiliensis]RGF14018.1 hypothetical protein DW175_15355 [Bacteroides sp. AM16-15]
MELRRRKYSEVSKQFILSVTDDKLGALKLYIKKAPVWAVVIIALMVGKKYWDYGYISFELIQNELIGLAGFGIIMLIVFAIDMLIPHHAYIGIHPEGIWLRNEQVGDIGFIEWGWIKDIKISSKYQIAYIVVYDMDSIKKSIAKAIGFETFVVATNGDEKAIKVPFAYFTQDILDCIVDNQFANFEVIE